MSDDGSESDDPYQRCAAAGGDDSGDSAASGGGSRGGGSGGAAAAAAAPAGAGAADSDGPDDFQPSPPRRNRARAAGVAPAAGARGKQPKWTRTVMEWETLPGGQAVLETSLDAFIEAHGRKVAAGGLCSLPPHLRLELGLELPQLLL